MLITLRISSKKDEATTRTQKNSKKKKKQDLKLLSHDTANNTKEEERTSGATDVSGRSNTRSRSFTSAPSFSSSVSAASSSSARLLPPRTITMDELEVGDLLGTGGYSSVLQARIVRASSPSPELDSSTSRTRRRTRAVAISNATTSPAANEVFAMKRLHVRRLKNKPGRLARQIEDLNHEGQILANLNERDDFVSIFAWSFSNETKTTTPTNDDDDETTGTNSSSPATTDQHHFLLLEQLDYTLEYKLEGWRAKRRSRCFHPSSVPYLMDKTSLRIRCGMVLDLAEALKFLHSKRILHRDLKPANVGFKTKGAALKKGRDQQQQQQLKLFDLGLARVLPPRSSKEDQQGGKEEYHLTGMVGTLRYMSPECGRHEDYGLKSDVYSFGLMCYEILSLQEPYGETFVQDKTLARRVWHWGERPNLYALSTSAASSVRTATRQAVVNVIQQCWDHESAERPSIVQAQDMLKNTLPLLWEKKTATRRFGRK